MANSINARSYHDAVKSDLFSTSKKTPVPLIPTATKDAKGNYVLDEANATAVRRLYCESLFHTIIRGYNNYQESNNGKFYNIRDAMKLRDTNSIQTPDDVRKVIDKLYGEGKLSDAQVDGILKTAMESTNRQFAPNGMEITIAKNGTFKVNHQKGSAGYISMPAMTSTKDEETFEFPVWKFPVSPYSPYMRNMECVMDNGSKGGYLVTPVEMSTRTYGSERDMYDSPYNLRITSGTGDQPKLNYKKNCVNMYNNLMFCPQFLSEDYDMSQGWNASQTVPFNNFISINDVLGISVFKPYCDDATMNRLTNLFTSNLASSNGPLYEVKYADAVKGTKHEEVWTPRSSRSNFKKMINKTASIIKYLNDNDIKFRVKPSKQGLVDLECTEVAGTSKNSFTITVMDLKNLELGITAKGTEQFVSNIGVVMANRIKY